MAFLILIWPAALIMLVSWIMVKVATISQRRSKVNKKTIDIIEIDEEEFDEKSYDEEGDFYYEDI